MSDFFAPQILTGTPKPAPLLQQAVGMTAPPVMPAPVMPPPPPPPAPVFVPVPVMAKPEKPKGLKVSPEAARKAQGIYPVEQQAKQRMIDNAKMPTPTGAWGAPK